MTDSLLPGERRTTAGKVVLAGSVAAVAIAVIGFFTGLRRTAEVSARAVTAEHREAAPVGSGFMPAYGAIGDARRGPNAAMYGGAFTALAAALPGPFEPVSQAPEDRDRAIAARATRRAYEGAPPTVPHAVDTRGLPACLACHEKGAVVAGRRAPAMSHARHDSCLQCHVPLADARGFGPSSPAPENAFAGPETLREGTRAWQGAPPTIPHPTLMREQCGSCHGVSGVAGLRTPHPYRESCTQCHAPSAVLDRRRDVPPPKKVP